MQAWGIGSALIMGGTGAGGAYASSALNREVCEQLMVGFQKKVVRHIRKRMEIIAEAQEHYDYELKGGLRVPLYREIVEEDPETGEQRIVRVPKLLILGSPPIGGPPIGGPPMPPIGSPPIGGPPMPPPIGSCSRKSLNRILLYRENFLKICEPFLHHRV
jgi:hypothetical protein